MKKILKWFFVLCLALMVISLIVSYKEIVFGIALCCVTIFILLKFSKRRTTKDPSPSSCSEGGAAENKSDVYVVLDIETTGFSRTNDRIIEIAANKYNKNGLVAQFHRYINPEVTIPRTITELTGITNEDVKGAPTIRKVKAELLAFLAEYPLIGHNIKQFDIPFLQAQLGHSFTNEVFDTLHLAKKIFPGLLSYKLSYLDQALHLGELEHHRAGNDIVITNALYLACKNPKKYKKFLTEKDRLASIPVEPKRAYYSNIDIHSITPTNPFATPNTSLTGKNIVFSGDFSLPLRRIMQIAVDAGATLKSSVSRKVDYLVVGCQDERFADENGMTGKSRTATRLNESGEANIQIISEKEFFQLLNQK